MPEGIPQKPPSPAEVDNSFVQLAEGGFEADKPESLDLTPVQVPVPETPMKHAEVMEGITQEEVRLNANVAENATILKATETKLDDPATREKSADLKWKVNNLKIRETYDKAKKKINELSLWGFTGAGALLASSMIPGMHGDSLNNAADSFLSIDAVQQSYDMAAHLAEGGIGSFAAVAGAWAIARCMKSLDRRSKENQNWQERQRSIRPQSA